MGMDAPDPDEAEGPSEAPPLGALERLRGLQAPRAIDLLVKPEVGMGVNDHGRSSGCSMRWMASRTRSGSNTLRQSGW